jgi:hypothetical protein
MGTQLAGGQVLKWFKHLSNLNRDQLISDYLGECGKDAAEGYGILMLLFENVAENMNGPNALPELTLSLPQWSRRLYSHHNRVSKYLGNLEVTGGVTVEYIEDKVKVIIPKLLELKDEYSRKSGHAPDNVAQKRTEEKRTEEKRTPPIPPKKKKGKDSDDSFDLFWAVYPKKQSKPDARSVWLKLAPTDELVRKILDAIVIQKKSDQWSKENGQFIPMPAGWLRKERWNDSPTEKIGHIEHHESVGRTPTEEKPF